MAMGERGDSWEQAVRWLEEGQRQLPALVGLVHENERLRGRLEMSESELERQNRERTELAERLTDFMNDVLLRLRPRSSVAEAA